MTTPDRRHQIEHYADGPRQLREALRSLPKEMWQYKSAPDRWSVHEIVVHLADSEANAYCRVRKLIAEPGSTVVPYDQEIWASALNYHAQSTDDALALFESLRRTTAVLLRMIPESAWAHACKHPENPNYTTSRWLEIYVDHVDGHIRQMQGNFAAWQAAKK